MSQKEISLKALEKAIMAYKIGLETYAKALAHETVARGNDQAPRLTQIGQLLRDGVIQRFEFTFDLARKLTKRTLFDIFKREEYDYRNDVWREAARYHLIANAEDWIKYHDNRNMTSHSYDEIIAHEVFQDLEAFLQDVEQLLQRIRHEIDAKF